MAHLVERYDAEAEETRTRLARLRIRPEWLRSGQWVLLRRYARFGCVHGEQQQSPRTVFEIVVCADGTRYLIPLDDAIRALRPIAEPEVAREMLQILRASEDGFGSLPGVARGMLSSAAWAHAMPATVAALLCSCYGDESLRTGALLQAYQQLERMVLEELELSLGLSRQALMTELHALHRLRGSGTLSC